MGESCHRKGVVAVAAAAHRSDAVAALPSGVAVAVRQSGGPPSLVFVQGRWRRKLWGNPEILARTGSVGRLQSYGFVRRQNDAKWDSAQAGRASPAVRTEQGAARACYDVPAGVAQVQSISAVGSALLPEVSVALT